MESSCRISAKVATMMTRNVEIVEGQQRSKRPQGIIVGSAASIIIIAHVEEQRDWLR